jgi:hypothetical protein
MTTFESMFDIAATDIDTFWAPEDIDQLAFLDETPTVLESNDALSTPLTLAAEQNVVKEEMSEQPFEVAQENIQGQNGWMLQSVRPDVAILDNSFLMIKVRSRGEDEEFNVIPECFYSSLRYTMSVSIDPSIFTNTKTTLLLARATIVDENGAEVLNKKGESVIKGPKEFNTLDLNRENGHLECKIPIRFSSVSFHHAKRNFAFHVSIHDFVDKRTELLFDVKSTPFPTYARRPKVSDRVAKVTTQPSTVNTAICKKRKTDHGKSATLMRFINSLEQLIALKDKLPEEEKLLALNKMSETLLLK